MSYLQIQLPSGSWRYVTSIIDNDFSHSIYRSRALEDSEENIKSLGVVLNKLDLADKIKIRINQCKWTYDSNNGLYETSCDKSFIIIDGYPFENDMKYCCYCGKPIMEGE